MRLLATYSNGRDRLRSSEACIPKHVRALLLFVVAMLPLAAGVFLLTSEFFARWDGQVVSTRPAATTDAQVLRVLIVGVLPGEVPLSISQSRILIAGPFFVMGSKNAGAGGAADIPLPIPNAPVLIGQSAYFQAWALNAGPWLGSVGLEVKFCK